ncbi:hypothetical protein FFLO_00207 [Filobasidium floriforme]|uniref:Uncharacterized protein n=1 Tax=Filobasidium floriforme TaxID=5210 RepID=A0A8K0NTN0_9TREE|nr:WD40-repeat-containing domain protein [Filobasidium floriforme]KAG7579999.1 hypothetical protein FFLO_00207 [Filobasidium floriforme]KAH8087400.1 WD40-repeat-containing domain protein [Filobasidium floriforme]
MLCRERRELEERWDRRRFNPKTDSSRPAKSAIYCSFAVENYIITGARNRSICFYEFEQEERALSIIFRIKDAHAGSVLCMEVDLLGGGGAGTMYTGGSDGRVNVWDLDGVLTEWSTFRGKPVLVKSMVGHEAGVLDLVVDNHRVLSCSKDGTVRVWCRNSLTSTAQVDLLGGPINCIALHQETGILVAAGCHGKITFYDLETMKPLQRCRSQTRDTVACVGFYDDLVVWGDTHLRLAQMGTGRVMFEQSADTELIRCFTIMPRTGRVITGSYSNQVGVCLSVYLASPTSHD